MGTLLEKRLESRMRLHPDLNSLQIRNSHNSSRQMLLGIFLVDTENRLQTAALWNNALGSIMSRLMPIQQRKIPRHNFL